MAAERLGPGSACPPDLGVAQSGDLQMSELGWGGEPQTHMVEEAHYEVETNEMKINGDKWGHGVWMTV